MNTQYLRRHPGVPQARTLALAVALALAAPMASAAGPTATDTGPQRHVRPSFEHGPWREKLRQHWVAAAAARSAQAVPARKAVTRSVTTLNDAGSGSLRVLLADAVDGDVIDLSGLSGKISLQSSLATSAHVTIKGPGKDRLVLEGSGKDRVITSAGSLTLSDVTITGGAAPAADEVVYGGCMLIAGDLQLTNATISGCTAGGPGTFYAIGGAIAVGGESEIKYSTLEDNRALAEIVAVGGALYAAGPSLLAGSTLSGNTARQIEADDVGFYGFAGGGAIAANGSALLLGSTVSGNAVAADGGTYTYFYGDEAYTYSRVGHARGGALIAGSGALLASTITGNQAEVRAGYGYASGGGVEFSGYTLYRTGTGRSAATLAANGSTALTAALERAGHGKASPQLMARLEQFITDEPPVSGLLLSSVSGNRASAPERVGGGGVSSDAPLQVYASAVSGNAADMTADVYLSSIAYGGGIAQGDALLEMEASTISGNSVTTVGEQYAVGGGMAVSYGGTLEIANSTISGNSATAGGTGDAGYGGGIDAVGASVHNSTIVFNTSSGHAGGLSAPSYGLVTLVSTVVAHNVALADPDASDVGGPNAVNGSHNLVMSSAGATLPPDTLTADPLLLPLAFNGGPTMTHAFAAASPLLNAGSNPLGLGEDQRGYAREVGAAPDIGALEHDDDRIFEDDFEMKLGGP